MTDLPYTTYEEFIKWRDEQRAQNKLITIEPPIGGPIDLGWLEQIILEDNDVN